MELNEAAGGLDDTVKAPVGGLSPERSSQANCEQDHHEFDDWAGEAVASACR